jgi:AP-2 complex subunit mu-1
MISGLLFYNSVGELVISRFYKSDFTSKRFTARVAQQAFRVKVVQAKNFTQPVLILDGSSFMYIRQNDIVIAAITRSNATASTVFQFLYEIVDVFRAYFDGKFSEQAIKSNFTLVYELLDEVMDHGYPQIVEASILQKYIQHGTAKEVKKKKRSVLDEAKESRELTSSITGTCSWRPMGIVHPKQEVFLDVIEKVTAIVSKEGRTLTSFANGVIRMKSTLSGMPVCRFGLNDMVAMKKRREKRGSARKVSTKIGIELQDVTFHKCVKLTQYDEDKTILFTPPDGEFDLMTYRIDKCNLPFDISPMVEEKGRNRVEYHIKLKAKYEKYVANDVEMIIPVPGNTSKCKMKTTMGKWSYVPTKSAVVWKIPKFGGTQSAIIKGEVKLTHLIVDKAWQRPPISMVFSIPMWPSSGIKVRFLNVQEPKLGYKSIKWVRYLTHGGDYQVRI